MNNFNNFKEKPVTTLSDILAFIICIMIFVSIIIDAFIIVLMIIFLSKVKIVIDYRSGARLHAFITLIVILTQISRVSY